MKTISIIIPVHNEEDNVPLIYRALHDTWQDISNYKYEFIFVDDGSTDSSTKVMEALSKKDSQVKCIEFSRNFGKEMATTAGIDAAKGDAVIMIDADLQHPPHHIPQFIKAWESGAEVVVGVRTGNNGEGTVKKWGSVLFYRIMGAISETGFEKGETDFRLIDRCVVDAYKSFPEHERMTRSLINWLGFRRAKIFFEAPARVNGTASYSTIKLVHLAVTSFLSHSLAPLRFTGYLGVGITGFAGILGVVVIIEKYILHDPFSWAVSASAQLAILIVFLVGIMLASIGIVGLYVGSIHTEVIKRPLYVVRRKSKASL